MGNIDITFKHLAARHPKDLVWLAMGRAAVRVDPLGTDTPAVRRETDHVQCVTKSNGQRIVLHMESQTKPESTEVLGSRFMAYNGLLHERENRKPVVTVLIEMRGTGPERRIEEYRVVDDGMLIHQFQYRVINLVAHGCVETAEIRPTGAVRLRSFLP